MKSTNHIPTSSLSLLQKILVDSKVYREINIAISEILIKIELKRIIMNKEIFIKDFSSISGFSIKTITEELGDGIRIESGNLKLKFDNLIVKGDDSLILNAILEREKEHQDLYYMILDKPIADQYIHMILNNQLDETKRSIRELEDLLSTIISENL